MEPVIGDIFRGRVKQKYCCVKEGGWYMKNKNIEGMCFVNPTWSANKAPIQKFARNAKIIKHWKIFRRSFRSLGILQNSYFWSS